jgi:hypothetical protein
VELSPLMAAGGGGGIRTPGERKPTPLFESGTISLSVTPPGVIIASEGA